jgi:hypothetical protein
MRSETSFELDGDLIVVDAIAVGPSGQVEVRLVRLNGASWSRKSRPETFETMLAGRNFAHAIEQWRWWLPRFVALPSLPSADLRGQPVAPRVRQGPGNCSARPCLEPAA